MVSCNQTGSTLDRLAVVTGRMAVSRNRHAGRTIKVERQEILFHCTDKQTVLTIIVNTDMH
jgi:hypothetical protein